MCVCVCVYVYVYMCMYVCVRVCICVYGKYFIVHLPSQEFTRLDSLFFFVDGLLFLALRAALQPRLDPVPVKRKKKK